MQEIHARVYGRVQFVMFRDFTCRNAKRLQLVGTVQNLPDGSVAVVAQGKKEALEELIGRLHKGSLLSRVERVDVEWGDVTTSHKTFTITY